MAPKKKSSPKKPHQRFLYSEEDLRRALDAVRDGSISASKAASAYRIPKSTLSNKLNGKFPEKRKMGPKPILTENEEDSLKRWILGKAMVGFPMHPEEVKDAVQRILKKTPRENPFTNDRPGEKWLTLLLKRHPEIRTKNTEIISKTRACLTEEGLRQWFTETRNYLSKNNILDILDRPRSIFCADETGVETCPRTGLVLGPKSDKNFYEITNGNEKESITVLCALSAAGETPPPMIVFPYKRIPAHIAQSVPKDWTVGRSDNGWIMQATFYEYIANIFHRWCVETNVPFPVIFFLDGHKSHISAELHEFCIKHKIILYCLPPNANHIVQPCDVAIFKPLKTHWKKVTQEHKQQTHKTVTKATFAPLLKVAFDRLLINDETIQYGFKTSGLYPFDENAVNYTKCISTKRANFYQDSDKFLPSLMDFEATKKVIEHFIGPTMTESFVDMKTGKNDQLSNNHLFLLWNLCNNHLEGSVNDGEPIFIDMTDADQNTGQTFEDSALAAVQDSFSSSGIPSVPQFRFSYG